MDDPDINAPSLLIKLEAILNVDIRDGVDKTPENLGSPDEWPDLFLPEYLSMSFSPIDDTGVEAYQLHAWFDGFFDVNEIEARAESHGFSLSEINVMQENYDIHEALSAHYDDEDARDVLQTKHVDIFRQKDKVCYPANLAIEDGKRGILHLWAPHAFGDGFHPTTRMVLEALDQIYVGLEDDASRIGGETKGESRDDDKGGNEATHEKSADFVLRADQDAFLDVGTGSGILSLVVHSLWECACVATDIEEDALCAVRENWERNDFSMQKLSTFCAPDLAHDDIAQKAPYKLAVANMVKSPLLSQMEHIASLQEKDCILIISGYTEEQKDDVLEHAARLGYVALKGQQITDNGTTWCCHWLKRLN